MLGVPLYDTVWSGSLVDYQPFGDTYCFHLQEEWPTTLQGECGLYWCLVFQFMTPC